MMINQVFSNPFANQINQETSKINISKEFDVVSKNKIETEKPKESFFGLLKNALGEVNQMDVKSEQLAKEFVINPEKVDVHTVTVAMSQSEMALYLTKSVIDRVINAYREISNLR